MKFRIVFFLVFVFSFCLAQVDTTYISPFEQNASARIYLINKHYSLNYEYNKLEENTSYRPNKPTGIGFGGSYKNTSLNIAYGFGFTRDKNKGKTKVFDLQYHHYGRKLIFHGFVQNYTGFYTKNEAAKKSYNLHPDIKLTHVGLFGQYLFNNKKFSYKAAFTQSEKQIKSAGSLQLGGGVYYNRIKSDSSLVLKQGNQEENYQLGANIGYAYTWVIKRFYLSGSLSFGVNAGVDNSQLKGQIKFNPTYFPRVSIGYNHKSWSAGFSYVNNRVYILFSDDLNTSFDSGNFQLAVIKRFNFSFKKKNL